MVLLSLIPIGVVCCAPGKLRVIKPPLLQRLKPVSPLGKSVKYVPTTLPHPLMPLTACIGPGDPLRVMSVPLVPISKIG